MKLFYDFHIHSCLSPCGDADMTPRNITNMAKLLGLDVIALTDHNAAENCPAVMQAGEEIGLTVLPGMELCTSEEVHIVCLFPQVENALAFSDYVRKGQPKIRNKSEIFGRQQIMDKGDNPVSELETLLITASAIRADHAVDEVGAFGGICFPAHIDRPSYSLLSNLGSFDKAFGFHCAEVADQKNLPSLKKNFPILNELKILSDSDAHYLEHMRPASQVIEAKSKKPADILGALK